MSNDSTKKYKRPKQKTLATTNPEGHVNPRTPNNRDEDRSECPEQVCPLLAKDSEWVDILQSQFPNAPVPSGSNVGDEEAVLQLVECEDGPQMKPLAIMFPSLLERDPQTLEGMLTKAMSTTEVTRHLVDLGEKANFSFMKKSTRLIPRDKQWLESLSENSNSHCSLESYFFGSSGLSDYDAETENPEELPKDLRKKRKRFAANNQGPILSQDSLPVTREKIMHTVNVSAAAFTVKNQQVSAEPPKSTGESENTVLDTNKS